VTACVVSVLLLAACAGGGDGALPTPSAPDTIQLTSAAFEQDGAIPVRYTCDGQSVSPPLSWQNPGDAVEFALLVTDPDAPGGSFVHWVVFGIPSNADSIGEGQGPGGARQGVNGFGRIGYGAPCPPAGDAPHRYVFTLYALSSARAGGLELGASAGQMLRAIGCCVQAEGTLTGTYGR
jgi:Raf kinase inhibitor-like YbhB/YbcL family protein